MTSDIQATSYLIQDLFVEQAARTPDRPAVISEGNTLTYGELLRLSQGWAWRLRRLGARSNRLVAVVMEKGWEQIVAVLGILESGAAYVPIDINVPKERLWYLLENGEVQIVLTQSRLDARLQWPANIVRLCVDTEAFETEGEHSRPPAQSPDDLAYVLYTSGSTGTPKGVMIAHRGVVNCILETNRHFQINAEDRCLALTALHHDMSVYDIFGLLAAGGAIVMPDPAGARAPDRWIELIDQKHVTVWNSVPAFMEMLLEYASQQNLHIPGRLRLAFLGGDWIPVSAPRRIHAHFGDVQVVSVGGPTETTLWNIWYPIRAVDAEWKSIPYGHAIANTRYYVLDDSLLDCPAGEAGELCCAGVGLLKGYWRDEERTRARFAIHPRTGETIFRTGDRGRMRADGEIEFLGRTDSQVKVLGQRIELGEIESILVRHPEVKRAVVNAVDIGGQKRLVAYVVPENGAIPTHQELRAYLGNHLACYMVPAAFESLHSMPLNSNGKIDRSALPAPRAWNSEPETINGATCANSLEDVIGSVWRRVLRVERFRPDDNFFDLGGNSLLLVEAHAELQRLLNRTFPVTRLFEFPSPRALQGHLDGQTSELFPMPELERRAQQQREAKTRQRRIARDQ